LNKSKVVDTKKLNLINICDMNTVINGYIRRLEVSNPNILIPNEIVAVCKKFYGNLKLVNILHQTILYDLMQQTLDFYRIESSKWIKLGIRQYFINLDKSICFEECNFWKWFSSKPGNEIGMSIANISNNEQKMQIDKLFEPICEYHIADLFDIYVNLNHYLIQEQLLMRIIAISSKFIGVDINSLIEDAIDKDEISKNELELLGNFLRLIFCNNTREIMNFVTTIYFYNRSYSIPLTHAFLKISKRTTAYTVEIARNRRIQHRLHRLVYFY